LNEGKEEQAEEGRDDASADKDTKELPEDSPGVEQVEEQPDEFEPKVENIDYLAQLKRTQADLENLQKRMESEKAQVLQTANEKLVSELLDTIDNFERALASMEESGSQELEGIRMVYEGMMKTLETNGLQRLPAGGQFDPHRHEAVMQEESDSAEDGTILEEFQAGYMFRSRVIRPSKVKVARNVKDDNNISNIKEEE